MFNLCLGWRYAALESGNICYCVTNFTQNSLEKNNCTSRCTGYTMTICGGPSGAATVYNTGMNAHV